MPYPVSLDYGEISSPDYINVNYHYITTQNGLSSLITFNITSCHYTAIPLPESEYLSIATFSGYEILVLSHQGDTYTLGHTSQNTYIVDNSFQIQGKLVAHYLTAYSNSKSCFLVIDDGTNIITYTFTSTGLNNGKYPAPKVFTNTIFGEGMFGYYNRADGLAYAIYNPWDQTVSCFIEEIVF